jgi:hypothetical protein
MRFNMPPIEIIFVSIFILVVFVALFFGVRGEYAQKAELHDQYMKFCTKDAATYLPNMEPAEVVERCEVAWKMERKAADSKNSTVIIFMPSGR